MLRSKLLNDIFENMMSMQRHIHQQHQHLFEWVNLSPSQIYVLSIIESTSQARPKDLANKLCLTPGAITQMLEVLEKAGYVERTPDKDDRRVVYISLTRNGKRKVAAIRKIRQELFQKTMNALDDSEVETYAALQRKIMDYFEKNATKEER